MKSKDKLENALRNVNLEDIVRIEARGIYEGEPDKLEYVGVVHELSKDYITVAPYTISSGRSGGEIHIDIESIEAIYKLCLDCILWSKRK